MSAQDDSEVRTPEYGGNEEEDDSSTGDSGKNDGMYGNDNAGIVDGGQAVDSNDNAGIDGEAVDSNDEGQAVDANDEGQAVDSNAEGEAVDSNDGEAVDGNDGSNDEGEAVDINDGLAVDGSLEQVEQDGTSPVDPDDDSSVVFISPDLPKLLTNEEKIVADVGNHVPLLCRVANLGPVSV
jgi:hypothetical protein